MTLTSLSVLLSLSVSTALAGDGLRSKRGGHGSGNVRENPQEVLNQQRQQRNQQQQQQQQQQQRQNAPARDLHWEKSFVPAQKLKAIGILPGRPYATGIVVPTSCRSSQIPDAETSCTAEIILHCYKALKPVYDDYGQPLPDQQQQLQDLCASHGPCESYYIPRGQTAVLTASNGTTLVMSCRE